MWRDGDGGVLKGKERVREKIELVSDTGGKSRRNKDFMRAIVREGRGKIEPSGAVEGPGRALVGGVMGDHQLTCGVNGVGSEVHGLAV